MVDHYLNEEGDRVDVMLLSTEQVVAASLWCNGVVVEEIDPFDENKRYPALNVQCRHEVKRASVGDYVLKRPDGTFDVKKPHQFLHEHKHWEV